MSVSRSSRCCLLYLGWAATTGQPLKSKGNALDFARAHHRSARRWRALLLDARVALALVPRVAEIITEETGQDADLLSFQKLCQQYVLNDRRV